MTAPTEKALRALADAWERGDTMETRARFTKPSDYAAALRALLAAAPAPASPEPRPETPGQKYDRLLGEMDDLWRQMSNEERGIFQARVKAKVAAVRDAWKSLAASPEPEGERASMWECPKCRRRFYAMSQNHPRECRPKDCIEDRPASPPSPAPRETSGEEARRLALEAPAGDGWDGVRESVAKGEPSPSPAAPAAAKEET